MVEPLKDPAYFARVLISNVALTWPNDLIVLHDEMKEAGLLRPALAAE
jgi:biotin-(acetyl-CoA carboxylase) ligase